MPYELLSRRMLAILFAIHAGGCVILTFLRPEIGVWADGTPIILFVIAILLYGQARDATRRLESLETNAKLKAAGERPPAA